MSLGAFEHAAHTLGHMAYVYPGLKWRISPRLGGVEIYLFYSGANIVDRFTWSEIDESSPSALSLRCAEVFRRLRTYFPSELSEPIVNDVSVEGMPA